MDISGAPASPVLQGLVSLWKQITVLQAENQRHRDQIWHQQMENCSVWEQVAALGTTAGTHLSPLMTPGWVTNPRVPLPERYDGTCSKFCKLITQRRLLFVLQPQEYAMERITQC